MACVCLCRALLAVGFGAWGPEVCCVGEPGENGRACVFGDWRKRTGGAGMPLTCCVWGLKGL